MPKEGYRRRRYATLARTEARERRQKGSSHGLDFGYAGTVSSRQERLVKRARSVLRVELVADGGVILGGLVS